jgi:SAM-dependent methyltransferase
LTGLSGTLKFDPRWLLARPSVYRTFVRVVVSGDKRSRYVANVLQPRPSDRVLDIGCGTADILDYLPGVDYHGFDANPAYIESARRRFSGRASFYCRRVGSDAIQGLGLFDLALATGVLHHLTDEQALVLLRLAYEALKPGGRLVCRDGCYVPGQNPIARLILACDRGRYVRDKAGYLELASSVFKSIKPTIYHDLYRIPYTHIVLECQR